MVSNGLAKGWEDHRVNTSSAHGLTIANVADKTGNITQFTTRQHAGLTDILAADTTSTDLIATKHVSNKASKNWEAGFTHSSDATGAVHGATAANTVNMIVRRDASGNFIAGTITAALVGNASTATVLQTARTIAGVSFDASANIAIPHSGLTSILPVDTTSVDVTALNKHVSNGLAKGWEDHRVNITSAHGLTISDVPSKAGSIAQFATRSHGDLQNILAADTTSTELTATKHVSNKASKNWEAGFAHSTAATGGEHGATAANTVNMIVRRDASGNFVAGTITANLTGNASGSSGTCTGNAATATSAATLTTARTIDLVSFNGSANILTGYNGTATFAGSTSYVTVTIPATMSGTTYEVAITPNVATSGTLGEVYTTTKGTTSFRVYNTGSNAAATFDWIVRPN